MYVVALTLGLAQVGLKIQSREHGMGLGEDTMKSSARQVSPVGIKQAVNDKAVKLLASSIYRQLQDEGCEARDIISVSSQLIDLVTNELQKVEDAHF